MGGVVERGGRDALDTGLRAGRMPATRVYARAGCPRYGFTRGQDARDTDLRAGGTPATRRGRPVARRGAGWIEGLEYRITNSPMANLRRRIGRGGDGGGIGMDWGAECGYTGQSWCGCHKFCLLSWSCQV